MTDGICITGLGMVSSLGRDVFNACAANRAGLTRITELKCLNFKTGSAFGRETLDGFPAVVGHTVPGVSFGFVSMAKVFSLGSAALSDLLANRPLSADELIRTRIHINLSDKFIQDAFADRYLELAQNAMPSQLWVDETAGLISKILDRCNISIPEKNHALYYGGHAGFVKAIQEGIEHIENGVVDRCLIGGIDSCIEPHFLQSAAMLRVLKTEENPEGFIPGEGGGFILLERLDEAKNAKLPAPCIVAGTSIKQDSIQLFSDDPPLGQALWQAIKEVLSIDFIAQKSLSLFVADLNGTKQRAMDWGHTIVRLQSDYGFGDLPLWLPAASFGETGAATGPLAICMAARGLERGYAPGNRAMVCLSSDCGLRGVIALQNPPA